MVILMILGVAVALNGVFLLIFSNFNIGTIATLFLGVALVLFGLFEKRLKKYRVLKNAFLILLCAEILLSGFISVYGISDNVDFTEDAVIVLGAAVRGDRVTLPLKYRLDKAVEYERKNPNALIVVTGGKGLQETVTEAEAMKKYLVSKGVNAQKIIKEEKATSTSENMRFSKKILDSRLDKPYKVAVVTNNFHIFRSVLIAKNEKLEDVRHIHAGLQWYNLIPCYLRESLAVLKTLIVG